MLCNQKNRITIENNSACGVILLVVLVSVAVQLFPADLDRQDELHLERDQ